MFYIPTHSLLLFIPLLLLRKIVSIAVLLPFLYNLFGYYFVFTYRQTEVRREVESRIAAGKIAEEDLVVLKMSVSVYVQTPNTEFQPIGGSFTYEGKEYEMVKQRIFQDTLYVYCTQNKLHEALVSDLSQHIGRSLSDTGNSQDPGNQLIKLIVKDYLPETVTIAAHFPAPFAQAVTRYVEDGFSSFCAALTAPPPEVA